MFSNCHRDIEQAKDSGIQCSSCIGKQQTEDGHCERCEPHTTGLVGTGLHATLAPDLRHPLVDDVSRQTAHACQTHHWQLQRQSVPQQATHNTGHRGNTMMPLPPPYTSVNEHITVPHGRYDGYSHSTTVICLADLAGCSPLPFFFDTLPFSCLKISTLRLLGYQTKYISFLPKIETIWHQLVVYSKLSKSVGGVD